MSVEKALNNSSAFLNVDLGAIINNYETLAGQAQTAACAAVVKANAYGLGMTEIAQAIFHNTRCTTFFVANLVEAVNLRTTLPNAVIYVFNGLFSDQIETYKEYKIRPILNDLSQVLLWSGSPEPCAMHFDTGINRLGLSEHEAEKFLNSRHNLNLELMISHLIRSEEQDHKTNNIQLGKFRKIVEALGDVPASLANSGGIFLGHEYHFDLVRPGIMLYGGNPGLKSLPAGLKPTFEIKARILQIRDVLPGMTVGYNATWTAEEPSRVALMNVGYADGTLKVSDRKSHVSINGHLAPVIGKVSMDMIAVNISASEFDKVKVSDFAEILGPNITLEMASEVSTLGQYELLTGIGHRYHRWYGKNNKLGAKI
ncbi:MAG: alanine racemase [Alphaproteobacteria bacterium]|nr:alanine racemase [Alphaproteobacteria bacterium]HPF46142.1 alanine racemase [Emcibacteraceae bacterium]HRW30328.1 alanine racemase [Emcibacteraceae bacterium]